jgi:chromosome partitioning protein
MIGRERALQKALLPVRGRYDYVLIDTPPSLGLLTINALTAADGVIVPVQCEYLSLRGLIQLENTLTMIRENLNPDVRIAGILPTMFDGRTLHSREAVEILEENFGDLVFETKIRKTIRYAEAPVKGTSVLKYDPKGKAAKAYRDLAGEVLRDG